MDNVDGRGREKPNPSRKCEGTFLDNRDFLGFRSLAWSSRRDGHPITPSTAPKMTFCGKKKQTPNRRAKMMKVKTKTCMTTSWLRNSGVACLEKVMTKMNLRDFRMQVCVLKKTNGSFRSHQVRKKSMINNKNCLYFSLSTMFSFHLVISYQYPTNLVASSVTKFPHSEALCLSRHFRVSWASLALSLSSKPALQLCTTIKVR